jgi:hypothetical protein
MATVTRLRSFLLRVLLLLLAANPSSNPQARHSYSSGLLVRLEKPNTKNLGSLYLEISLVRPCLRLRRIPTLAVAPVVEIAPLATTVNSIPTGITSHSLPTGSYGGPATLSRSPNQPAVEWNVLQCDGCTGCNTCFSCFCVGCFNCNDCGGCGSCSSCGC